MSEAKKAPPKKRVRRKGGNEEARALRMYFNAGTQEAIVEYQKCERSQHREKLYVDRILPAFQKLVENLINIHRFTDLYDTNEDMKNDCVNFLFETIPKFDSTRGTNAFSYFNVVAKNWLIIRTKQKTIRTKRYVSMEENELLSQTDKDAIEYFKHVPSHDVTMEMNQRKGKIMEVLRDIRKVVRTDNERLCIESIIHIFENVGQLDFFNRNAIMLYIREMTGLSTKQLSSTLQSMRKNYRLILLSDDD